MKKPILKKGAPEKKVSGPHRALESFLNVFPIHWFNISNWWSWCTMMYNAPKIFLKK
jgi:hypothetical protein